jgi:hypothetical protein
MRFSTFLLFVLLALVLVCAPAHAQKSYGHGNYGHGYYGHSYTHYNGYYPYYGSYYVPYYNYTPSYGCTTAAPAVPAAPASDADKALKELLLRKLIAEQVKTVPVDVPVLAYQQPAPQYASKPGDQLSADEIAAIKELLKKAAPEKPADK